jgi:cephalosporin-C deacetylase-like acetyl esterase
MFPHGQEATILATSIQEGAMKTMSLTILFTLSAGLILLSLVGATAQDLPGDRMMEEYLAQETKKTVATFMAGIESKEDWEKIRPGLKEEYFYMLGLWPLPERTPLNATTTGTLERPTFRVEKLHFQSMPRLYVTGNLYLPKKVEGRLPAILYLCGHSGKGKNGNKTAFQHHGIWFANNGYVCLIIDTLMLGEIGEPMGAIHHGTYRYGRWWWHSKGYTPAGVECWNAIRAIDYLVSRPEVDPERIGVTGISGGGAGSFWVAAGDERVKAAVPVSGLSDLETQVIDKVINGHCDCMFFHNTYLWPLSYIPALIAPRPFLFANSDWDTIFPMPGNQRIRDRMEFLYGLYGKTGRNGNFDICVVPGGHSDSYELRLMAYRFMNRHLRGDNSDPVEPKPEPFKLEELRVFAEDSDIPSDQLNTKIDELFVRTASVALPSAEDFPRFKEQMLKDLKDHCFRAWPDSYPSEIGDVRGKLYTEPPIYVQGAAGSGAKSTGTPCLVVLNPGETPDNYPPKHLELLADNYIIFLMPRGVGATAWTTKNPPNYVERSLALLGRTVDSGRVWDVRVAAFALNKLMAANGDPNPSIRVLGKGQAGVIAAYAALFEPAISEVVLVEPTESHMQGPHFLNVLRVLDIPDALGLLAPRKLTVYGAKPEAFEKTAALYKIAGPKDNFALR